MPFADTGVCLNLVVSVIIVFVLKNAWGFVKVFPANLPTRVKTTEVARMTAQIIDLQGEDMQNIDSKIDDVIMKWDLFKRAPIGIYIIQRGRFVAVNKEFSTYTGYSEKDLFTIDPLDIVADSFRDSVRKNAIEMLKSKRDKPYQYLAKTKDCKELWVMEAVIPTKINEGRATIGFFMDIEKIVNDSLIDSLTGLHNRRYFDDCLRRETQTSSRYRSLLSLMLLDVDHFKRYNDNYGHVEGDKVLRKIGDIIKKSTRQIDIGCRYGGEEFVVILPQSCIEDASVVAERIRKSVEVQTADLNNGVTVSAGISQYKENQKISEFISNSDTALYQAKENGRNCIYSRK